MRVTVSTKQVKNLTPIEYKACYAANYGDGGYMRGTLLDAREGWSGGMVIMLWKGPHDTPKNMIGWALLTPVSLHGYAAGTSYTKTKAKYTVQFWIKKQYRRKGYGHRLMKQAKKYDSRPHVFPHSNASGEFFSGYEITTQRELRGWMRNGKPKVA